MTNASKWRWGNTEVLEVWTKIFVFKCETVFQEWESPGLSSAAHLFLLLFGLPFTEIRFFVPSEQQWWPRLQCQFHSLCLQVDHHQGNSEWDSGGPGRHLQDGAGVRPARSYTTLPGFCLVSQVPCRFQGPVNLNKPWAPSRQGQLEALGLEGEVEALGWKCRGAHERNFQAE